MKNLGSIGFIASILVIIGGLNWGLIGLFGLNIVSLIFGQTLITRLIYLIVGLAASYLIYHFFKTRKSGK